MLGKKTVISTSGLCIPFDILTAWNISRYFQEENREIAFVRSVSNNCLVCCIIFFFVNRCPKFWFLCFCHYLLKDVSASLEIIVNFHNSQQQSTQISLSISILILLLAFLFHTKPADIFCFFLLQTFFIDCIFLGEAYITATNIISVTKSL